MTTFPLFDYSNRDLGNENPGRVHQKIPHLSDPSWNEVLVDFIQEGNKKASQYGKEPDSGRTGRKPPFKEKSENQVFAKMEYLVHLSKPNKGRMKVGDGGEGEDDGEPKIDR